MHVFYVSINFLIHIAKYLITFSWSVFCCCYFWQIFPLFSEHSTFDQMEVPVVFTAGAICGIYFGGKEMRKRIRQIDDMISALSKK